MLFTWALDFKGLTTLFQLRRLCALTYSMTIGALERMLKKRRDLL
jgi:hypothetical protein